MKNTELLSKRSASWDNENENDGFEVTFTSRQSGRYNIYLFGVIESPRQFIGAIEVMHRATEDDEVIVHLSTDGGSADATDTFLSAMRECEGEVLVKASGGVHSAGTIILMNAPSFQLSRDFNCLIHNGSTGSGGKLSDFIAASKAQAGYMERLLSRTYEGFLDPSELDAMLAGKDFWLDAEQWMERYKRRQDFLKAKYDAIEAAEAAKANEPSKPARKAKKTT